VVRLSILWLVVAGAAWAQAPAPQEPPEEDVDAVEKTKEYTLNPIQAAKELKIGNFYLKKGSHKAAVRRFEEALKWDPNMAEAYLKLGEAHTKAGDAKAARAAWEKYLELDPDGKEAEGIRRKLWKK
jgi:tetratricopeptide (TPR) repeat protein